MTKANQHISHGEKKRVQGGASPSGTSPVPAPEGMYEVMSVRLPEQLTEGLVESDLGMSPPSSPVATVHTWLRSSSTGF